MKNSKLAVLIVALSVTGFCNHACAQNKPSFAPRAGVDDDGDRQRPINEQATAEAWAAFRAGENEKAITNADQCIARYRLAADRSQATLEADKIALPKGTVSEAEKKRIAQYQILHDVATCFLIKGWAEEKLGHKEEARKAYTEARKYPLARAADPNGESFLSPAEAAATRAAALTP